MFGGEKVFYGGFYWGGGDLVRGWLKIVLVNMYSPCDFSSKKYLWEDPMARKTTSQIDLWCIIGDFNVGRMPYEKLGVGVKVLVWEKLDCFISLFRRWKLTMFLSLAKDLLGIGPMVGLRVD